MPSSPSDFQLEVEELVRLMELCAAADDEDPVHDELWASMKRLYRMLHHIPGIRNEEDAPERQN